MGDSRQANVVLSSGRILGRPRLSHSEEPIIITAPSSSHCASLNCEDPCKSLTRHENTRPLFSTVAVTRPHKQSVSIRRRLSDGVAAARLQNRR